jgi:hypothetical protein
MLPLERLRMATLTVPDHVAIRAFPEETVVLNLETGKYYSLNPSGGAFLEALRASGSFSSALADLHARFPEQGAMLIERHLHEFCTVLASSGLLAVHEA